MAEYLTTDTDLQSVADAIRAKSKTSAQLVWPAGYNAAINAINPLTLSVNTSGPSSIVSVNDAADLDAKRVVVSIEPVQDLHGYDSPWPAGGNAQLLDIPDAPETTRNGVTYRIENGVIYANGTCTYGFSPFTDIRVEFPSGTYTFSAQLLSGSIAGVNNSFNGFDSGDNRTWLVPFGIGALPVKVTKTADIRRIGAAFNSGAVFNNAAIAFQIEAGSEMSAFRPYSNICPITGWTGAKVTRRGKNLFDIEKWLTDNGSTYTKNGDYTLFNASSNLYSNFCSLPQGTKTVSFSFGSGTVATNTRIRVLYADGTINSNRYDSPVTGDIVGIALNWSGSGAIEFKCQVELGSTATDYEPYVGDTYDITFPSSAGTVYGGTLTIDADGGGELVVDRAIVDLGTLSWASLSWGYRSSSISDVAKKPNKNSYAANIVSSRYKTQSYSATAAYGIALSSDGLLGITDTSASPTGDLCYELATPVTYTLTAEQILLLPGINNIWSDCGNTTIEYFTEDFANLAEEIGFAEGGDY